MDKITLIVPGFLLLAFFDWQFAKHKNAHFFSRENSVINLCIGGIDRVVSLAHFSLLLLFLNYLYVNFRVNTLSNAWYNWVLAYVALDFVSYWYHRFSHRINILWAGHITHHSSSYYNLTNSFRTSPFQGFNRIVFWSVLPIIGFSTEMLFTTFIVSSLYDFFVHTQNAPKIRWLEHVFITPSLHKVHHGKNPIYVDKNYGSTFVVWDKWFNTFQDETEPVSFGISSPDYVDNDPIRAIFYHYQYLWNTIKKTPSFSNKILLLIKPPEWTPQDLQPDTNAAAAENIPLRPTSLHSMYAWFVFSISTVGIFCVLLFKDLLDFNFFIIASIIFLSGMVVGTRIFSNNLSLHLKRNELIKNMFFICILLILVLQYSNEYALWILLFVGSSSLLMLFLPNVKKSAGEAS